LHKLRTALSVTALVLTAFSSAAAADKYSSGSKTWDTTTSNWGTSSGVYSGSTWDNSAPDWAIFEGTGGTVTLGEAISIGNILINAEGYTISGNVLNFTAGGNITVFQATNNPGTIISSGITGSPSLTFTEVITGHCGWLQLVGT